MLPTTRTYMHASIAVPAVRPPQAPMLAAVVYVSTIDALKASRIRTECTLLTALCKHVIHMYVAVPPNACMRHLCA